MTQELWKDTRGGAFLTTSASRREAPAWLAGALVVLRAIRVGAIGSDLEHRLRVARGRAGRYAPVDFVVVLLTCALAGASDLKTLYGQLVGVSATALGPSGGASNCRLPPPCRASWPRSARSMSPR